MCMICKYLSKILEQQCVDTLMRQSYPHVGMEFKYTMRSPIQNQIRDVLVRDEPTRTCCGLLQSWVPIIKILEKIKNIDFNFENQD